MNPPLSFCVIVPMYNEEDNARTCVQSISKELDSLDVRGFLVAVNDGSIDSTPDLLEELQLHYPQLVVVTHSVNQGYGAALRSGVIQAKENGYDYALFMDSDMTNDPIYIRDFVEKMREGYDVIKASRYIKNAGMRGVQLYRVIISTVGNQIARFLFRLPVTDCTNGFRAIKVDLLAKMPLKENGFPMIMEELYYAKLWGQSFCDIPNILTARANDQGQSKFSYTPAVMLTYLKYPLMAFFGIKPTRQ